MKERLLFLARLMVTFILTFFIGKVCFMLYNHEMESFGLTDVLQVLWHGLSMDLSTCGYFIAIPFLLCIVSIWWKGMPLRQILATYYVLISVALCLSIWSDTFLYEFWRFKLNASIFNYMQNAEGAANSVSLWYMVGRTLTIVSSIVLLTWVLLLCTPHRISACKKRILCTTFMVLLIAPLFLMIRGGLQEGTMNVGWAYYSQRIFLNHSAVNPTFSLLSSIKRTEKFSEEFNYFPEEERAQWFNGLYPTDTEDITDTLLNTTRPQLLIVLMESFGGMFFDELGGLPDVAPNISRLIPEGVWWDNYYSNSFRTDRGTVSTFSGWVSYPTTSLMRLPDKLNPIRGIASTLAQEGYATDYLYAGDIKIMGKQGYLVHSGYQTLTSDKDFSLAEINESKWGANDSVSAMRTFHMIAERPLDSQWHMGYQTLSSHEPYEVPYHRLEDKTLNAFAFTDHCVGMLIDSLKTLPVWDNLLVVLLPDHGSTYCCGYDNPLYFHSPMLWLGGAIKEPRTMHVLMSQSDMAATLLSQMGISHKDYPWSRNVLSKNYTYPFAYSTYPSGILFADSTGVTVLDITSNTPINETPTPSADRLMRAKAILQTSYDLLEEMH